MLLPNKNSTTYRYTQKFRFIENHIMRIAIICVDFEKAIHVIISEIWPQSKS